MRRPIPDRAGIKGKLILGFSDPFQPGPPDNEQQHFTYQLHLPKRVSQ